MSLWGLDEGKVGVIEGCEVGLLKMDCFKAHRHKGLSNIMLYIL